MEVQLRGIGEESKGRNDEEEMDEVEITLRQEDDEVDGQIEERRRHSSNRNRHKRSTTTNSSRSSSSNNNKIRNEKNRSSRTNSSRSSDNSNYVNKLSTIAKLALSTLDHASDLLVLLELWWRGRTSLAALGAALDLLQGPVTALQFYRQNNNKNVSTNAASLN